MTRRWRVRPADRPTRRETGAPIPPAASAATYPLRCFAPQWARFDNRHSTSAPTPTLTAVSGSGARGTSSPLNRQCYPPHFMRECIPPNLHDPQRAKGSLDRRSKRLSFPHFFLRRKKCGRRRPPPRQGEINSPPGRRNSPNPVEANTPTVAGASGRGSLRAGERRHSPFDRQ